MNRQQKRDYERKLKHLEKTNPKAAGLFKELIWLKQRQYMAKKFGKQYREGDKVQIDAEAIYADVNSAYLRQDRIEFVKAHKNDVFTVEYDPKFTKDPVMFVCFKEDEHDPKWLWHIADIKKVEDAD